MFHFGAPRRLAWFTASVIRGRIAGPATASVNRGGQCKGTASVIAHLRKSTPGLAKARIQLHLSGLYIQVLGFLFSHSLTSSSLPQPSSLPPSLLMAWRTSGMVARRHVLSWA
jgi:hypothetical protein